MKRTIRSAMAAHCPLFRRGQVLCALLFMTLLPAQAARARQQLPPGEPAEGAKPADEQQDADLAEKLLRRANQGADEDIMSAILRLMEQSASRMENSFDPGPETQQTQAEILTRLDEAIKQAALQRQPKSSSQSKPQSDKRAGQPTSDQQQKNQQAMGDQDPNQGPGEPAEGADKGTVDRTAAQSGKFLESRRGWGNLPERDREEVIQGSGERFLERYREWIERYYRALQEAE